MFWMAENEKDIFKIMATNLMHITEGYAVTIMFASIEIHLVIHLFISSIVYGGVNKSRKVLKIITSGYFYILRAHSQFIPT